MRKLWAHSLLLLLFSIAGVVPILADGGELVEVNAFGGGSFFRREEFKLMPGAQATRLKLISGGLVGLRVTENIGDYWSLEQTWGIYGANNVRFSNAPGVRNGTASFSNRLRQFQFNVVRHLTPRDSWIRPFFTAGLGANWHSPTQEAKLAALDPVNPLFGAMGPVRLGLSTRPAFNYGGGIKAKISPNFGFRFDIRGLASPGPTFGIPRLGSQDPRRPYLFLPKNTALNGTQITGGISFYFGETGPKLTHEFTVPPSIEGVTAICPGETATLRLPARDTLAGHKARYRWTVNGQDANNNNSDFRFTAPQKSGDYTIAVHVEDEAQSADKAEMRATKRNPAQPADRTATLHVKEYKNPTATCEAGQKDLRRGETTSVSVTAKGSECSGQMSYRWSASEGSVSGGATGQYDSTGVAFDQSITDREQRKNITLTATVNDEKGGTASCAVNVTVRHKVPVAERRIDKPTQLDDIIFSAGSARVNNCGKRILADELYPLMTRNRDYNIWLIGHIDAKESPKAARRGRRTAKASQLDRERVLNTAAFLSAGKETCKDIELSRIKVDWVGTDQTSEFKPRFCETSTREKKGQAIRSRDPHAKNQRVEIWLVPQGTTPPTAAKAIKDAPVSDIRAKGCPK
ncbi:MAG: hypothetical protein HYR55_04830 [Acidobacteria bacterium]|nr:hypothetical protein [Acidobacteriota bacterium]MBI3654976.1 hypothetical protein [Acidobacteriota bacterium]